MGELELESIFAELEKLDLPGNVPLSPNTQLQLPESFKTKNDDDMFIQELKERFLTPSTELPWSLLNEFESPPVIDDEKKDEINFSLMELPTLINRTAFRFKRSGINGSISSVEEDFDFQSFENSASSLSFGRKFSGQSKLNVKGSSMSLPFLPGGLKSDPTAKSNILTTKNLHRDKYGLFDIPEGFHRGLQENLDSTVDLKLLDGSNVDEMDVLAEEIEDDDNEGSLQVKQDTQSLKNVQDDEFEKEITQLVPKDTIVRPSLTSIHQQQKRKTEWAHVVDLNHKIENFDELIPNPARTWPFELDVFQQEAIYHLEQGDSVFVAAHTSAGKTVVAEYAIAMANKNMTKAIYTSPIKALSNQKFRDFRQTFKDMEIGVITGDVQINPEANCLIMTTEILRSMLYRGSDVIRDVEFVIFDEVHYVNDIDRGVVWEEVIIMLPDHVKIILLSATVPNTYEFASWVGRTKQKDIYVISTPKRPVPLEIFLFAKDTPYKVIDSNRRFLETGYNQHADKFLKVKSKDTNTNDKGKAGSTRGGTVTSRGGRGGSRGGGNAGPKFIRRDAPTSKSWTTLVNYLRKQDLLPAVIFVFSKKRCEDYAESLSGFDFSTAKESSEIHMFIDKAVSRLKKEDRELPQILRMREMLKRGIAVHHGGLLPIIKEVVEILFSKSLIKILFATETFAMGLNLPTRTVVFSAVRKHDGSGFRDLLPGEFTQMSGRAGRRGLDKIGTVMIMAYQQPVDRNTIKQVALGMPTKLASQFRLTYTMILNLLRIEALKVEDMIKRSFGENASQSMLPDQQLEIVRLEKEIEVAEKPTIEDEKVKELEEVYRHGTEVSRLKSTIQEMIYDGPKGKKYFSKGRVVVFKNAVGESVVGIIVKNNLLRHQIECIMVSNGTRRDEVTFNAGIFFDPRFSKEFNDYWFPEWKLLKKFQVVTVDVANIEFAAMNSIKITMSILHKEPKAIQNFSRQIEQLLKERNTWKEIDLISYMNEVVITYILKFNDEMTRLINILNDSKLVRLMADNRNYLKVSYKMNLLDRVTSLKESLSDENLELLPEYNKRLEVLKELNYVNSEQLTINLKGRVACEINSGFELIITELVFENFLGGFTAEEIVALLSCFVYDGKKGDKNDEQTKLATARLEKGKEKICSIVERLLVLSTEYQIQITAEEEQFLEVDRFALCNTVYEWARGRSFKEIMEYANEAEESEGTIVRVITFLDEICNQVRNAALITGDAALHSKMVEAQEKIKRDIVFCASLYL
ncbi:hypothetical protein CANINC_001463 [Pichia inconspicua]|uniref:Antiviral helicase SKI2 n=1 Tax=Pichia inconspicua TaxID=52247 RepID=A0A4T0X4U4_9ASCO|nr:hypothetical protein CANINC_001463 [[Candida] inconspicua]